MQLINAILITAISSMPYGDSIWPNNQGLSWTNINQPDSSVPKSRDSVQFYNDANDRSWGTSWSFNPSLTGFSYLKSEPEVEPEIAVDPPVSNWEDANESSFNESDSPLDVSENVEPFINDGHETFDNDSFSPLDPTLQDFNQWEFNDDVASFDNGNTEQTQESPFNTWNLPSVDAQQFGNNGGFESTQQPKASKQFQSEQGQGRLGFYNINL